MISRKTLNIIPGTKVQYKKRHLMTSAFLTLMKGQGHTTRSNVTDVEVSAFSECFLFIMTSMQKLYFQLEIDFQCHFTPQDVVSNKNDTLKKKRHLDNLPKITSISTEITIKLPY